MASAVGLALEGEKTVWEPSPEKFDALGITEAQWRAAEFDARAEYDRLASALN